MRQWWNWYTRWSKKPMPKGLRVRVSSNAPIIRIIKFNLGVAQSGQRTWPGTKRSQVQILPSRPNFIILEKRLIFCVQRSLVSALGQEPRGRKFKSYRTDQILVSKEVDSKKLRVKFNYRSVAQSGQRICFGSRGSQVRILLLRPINLIKIRDSEYIRVIKFFLCLAQPGQRTWPGTKRSQVQILQHRPNFIVLVKNNAQVASGNWYT